MGHEAHIETETYNGPNRRRPRSMSGSQLVTNDDLDEALEVHSQKERAHVDQLIKEILKAFPDEDIDGHCGYHQSKIEAALAEKEFWDTAKKALITNGVSGIFALVKVILLLVALGLTVKFSMPETTAKIILGIVGK